MLIVGAYHIAYLALWPEGRRWARGMIPQWKDARDLVTNFAFYLGLRKEKAAIERFACRKKPSTGRSFGVP